MSRNKGNGSQCGVVYIETVAQAGLGRLLEEDLGFYFPKRESSPDLLEQSECREFISVGSV